jgi:D-arginine dehydrogenase
MLLKYDVIVIGAGIAGAGVAAELARDRRVALVEMEDHPGAHATGRSAAVYSELYGNEIVRRLTRASYDFFQGDDKRRFVRPRACFHVATAAQCDRLDRFFAQPDVAANADRIGEAELRSVIPALRPGIVIAAIAERNAQDLDVDAVHQHFLKTCRGFGGVLHLSERVTALAHSEQAWTVTTTTQRLRAPIVVNAAGAWGDVVAHMASLRPIGLEPRRRTAALIDLPYVDGAESWPMTVDIDEQYYFKPDAGKLLISPADETLSEPLDAFPEELDIAIAADRVQAVLDVPIQRVSHSWAGLRTFAPDRTPVIGFDEDAPGFLWLVGQGGYGIQTAPSISRLAASLIRSEGIPPDLAEAGMQASDVAPGRLNRRSAHGE